MYSKSHRRNKSFSLSTGNRMRPINQSVDVKSHQMNRNSLEQILKEAKHEYYDFLKYDKARKLFEQYLQYYPKNNEVNYLCGICLLQVGKEFEAIQKLKAVTQEYENHPNALLLAAIATNKLGNTASSLDISHQCLKYYPDFEEALCFRARLHMKFGCYSQAELDFRKAFHVNKYSYLACMGIGDCFKAENDVQKAISYYQRALKTIQKLQDQKSLMLRPQIQMKMGICYYSFENYQKSLDILSTLRQIESINNSDLYYYLGSSQLKLQIRDKGLLNLEYCIRLQTNPQLIEKAYKKLILAYLQDYQFYEAIKIVELGQSCRIDAQYWKKAVLAFMMVIKGSCQQALKSFEQCLSVINSNQKEYLMKKSQNQLKNLKNPIKIELGNHKRKVTQLQSPKYKDKIGIKTKKKYQSYNKSVAKAIAKISSFRNQKNTLKVPIEHTRHKTEHFSSQMVSTKQRLKEAAVFSQCQKEVIYPIILKFKAYASFFTGNYVICIDTYEEYEAFQRDMFGEQSDFCYNKQVAEGLLMVQEGLAEQALSKFSESMQTYYNKFKEVPLEPVLYKITLLIKLAALKAEVQVDAEDRDSNEASPEQILDSTLKLMSNYRKVLYNSAVASYLQSIIYTLKDDSQLANEYLEKALKSSQECSYRYLLMKGVIEINLGHYYDAVKEFSAGVILQVKPQFYLYRAICLLVLHQQNPKLSSTSIQNLLHSVKTSIQLINEQKHIKQQYQVKGNTLIQYCFADLHHYIECCTNEEVASKWVARILFATRSYEEALASIVKIADQTEEFIDMAQCISIYEGEYERGGDVGMVIKSAFDGAFLSQSQQAQILQKPLIKNYSYTQFGYLKGDYEKWLILIHLYRLENYSLMLKYLQNQLFIVKDVEAELFLRYNLFVVYLLIGEQTKAQNIGKSLLKFQSTIEVDIVQKKMIKWEFEQDQCMEQLNSLLGIAQHKLLSSSLPYQKVIVQNEHKENMRVFVRISAPFPPFPMPNLSIKIDWEFVIKQMSEPLIENKLQAPWVRKTRNMVQFTQCLDESISSHLQLSSKHTSTQKMQESLEIL